MSIGISGHYMSGKTSLIIPARLNLEGKEIIVFDQEQNQLVRANLHEIIISDRLGNIPRKVSFPDSSHFETKMKAIMSFKSQFYEPGKESETLISSKKFLDFIKGRSHEMGSSIQVEHGEGFTSAVPLQLDLKNLL